MCIPNRGVYASKNPGKWCAAPIIITAVIYYADTYIYTVGRCIPGGFMIPNLFGALVSGLQTPRSRAAHRHVSPEHWLKWFRHSHALTIVSLYLIYC